MDYDAIRAFWDRNARGRTAYSAGNFLDEPAARFRHDCETRTFRRLVCVQGKSLLELGCGGGRWGLALTPSLRRYHGVDVSPSQIQVARAALPEQAQLTCIDVRLFDTKERFDIVYLSGLIQYLTEDDALSLLASVRRWLSPGGLVISRDSVQEKRPTRHHRDGDYQCTYRQRVDHIALLQGVLAAHHEPLLLTRELDGYGTPAAYPIEALKMTLGRHIPRFVAAAWYPIASQLSWIVQTRGRFLYAWDLRHKFFLFESRAGGRPSGKPHP